MDERIRELERAFRKAGMPNLIRGYSATEDVFTRAIPLLTLVFVLEMFNALNLSWNSAVANALAFLGGIALTVGAFGALNVVRGRPFASVPARVGAPELAAFAVLPALLPLVFGGQWRSSLVTFGVNVSLLAIVYLVIAFGLFSILRWAGERFVAQLRASLVLLVRALPLLLFFALVTFFTNEYWQMFAGAKTPKFIATIALFVVLGCAFLLLRVPTGVRELERDSDLGGSPLGRAQRVNVGLVIFVSQALQVLFVSVAVWLFFVVFGALLVDGAILRDWVGHTGREILTLPFFGDEIHVTRELLRVATGTAAFSGLYYTVAIVVDSNYRDEFVTRLTEQMRDTFARRSEYLRLLAERSSASRSAAGA